MIDERHKHKIIVNDKQISSEYLSVNVHGTSL